MLIQVTVKLRSSCRQIVEFVFFLNEKALGEFDTVRVLLEVLEETTLCISTIDA